MRYPQLKELPTTREMVDAAERQPDYILKDVHELHQLLRT